MAYRSRAANTQGATTDVVISKITVTGRVELANILAGFNPVALGATNGDAQIGTVKVGGNWLASNIVAGSQNLGADNAVGGTGANADNVNFGDAHDSSIGMGTSSQRSPASPSPG